MPTNSQKRAKQANILAEIIIKYNPSQTKNKLLSDIDLMQKFGREQNVKKLFMSIQGVKRQSAEYFINNVLDELKLEICEKDKAEIKKFMTDKKREITQQDIEQCMNSINLNREKQIPLIVFSRAATAVNCQINKNKKPKIQIMECDSSARDLIGVEIKDRVKRIKQNTHDDEYIAQLLQRIEV
ncbi:hypothetical protein SS50377_26916 [Spironucleus salmonicida]|uniref:Uncharacterized protein n=1 Tax=Spironucleus salmonicida TaxID=348837 RepID=V6LRZ2_9EUKA|nr:hypothetical protein SS50377_26916 [Spironucleus salmonicida]|eukprot:EST47427.1 Hypothetical protein SS50377_12412 [Spironucleus salmonicida]